MINLHKSLIFLVYFALALLKELTFGLDVPDFILSFLNLLLQALDILHLQLVSVEDLLFVLLVYFILLLQQ